MEKVGRIFSVFLFYFDLVVRYRFCFRYRIKDREEKRLIIVIVSFREFFRYFVYIIFNFDNYFVRGGGRGGGEEKRIFFL